jgi:hypothetical protein
MGWLQNPHRSRCLQHVGGRVLGSARRRVPPPCPRDQDARHLPDAPRSVHYRRHAAPASGSVTSCAWRGSTSARPMPRLTETPASGRSTRYGSDVLSLPAAATLLTCHSVDANDCLTWPALRERERGACLRASSGLARSRGNTGEPGAPNASGSGPMIRSCRAHSPSSLPPPSEHAPASSRSSCAQAVDVKLERATSEPVEAKPPGTPLL